MLLYPKFNFYFISNVVLFLLNFLSTSLFFFFDSEYSTFELTNLLELRSRALLIVNSENLAGIELILFILFIWFCFCFVSFRFVSVLTYKFRRSITRHSPAKSTRGYDRVYISSRAGSTNSRDACKHCWARTLQLPIFPTRIYIGMSEREEWRLGSLY